IQATVTAVLFVTLTFFVATHENEAQQRQRPRKAEPAKTTPAPEPQPGLTPREVLDRARNSGTQDERIALLEKFVASARGTDLEREARELLKREYALKGEQALREANPQQAMRAFKSVFRTAADPIT